MFLSDYHNFFSVGSRSAVPSASGRWQSCAMNHGTCKPLELLFLFIAPAMGPALELLQLSSSLIHSWMGESANC